MGYSGVDWFEWQGAREPEIGWRLATEARGKGYATEAAQSIVDLARTVSSGWLYCIIDPDNAPSHRVAAKLGFSHYLDTDIGGPVNLLRMDLG